MAHSSSRGVPLLLLFVLLPDSSPFEQKTETVCHSSSHCGRAQLTCHTGQRLAILGVSRAYHLNTAFDQCASSVQNCSAVPMGCCQPLQPPLVCLEDYPAEVLEEAYSNCSAQVSGVENVTCVLELTAVPLSSDGRCEGSSVYRNLSSYSVVDYACSNESDAATFCEVSQKRGNLVYAFWTPADSPHDLNDVNATSCRCSVATDSRSPANIFVRALDVRIPRSDAADECSYVTIEDAVSTHMNTTCSNRTMIQFDASSQFATATQSKSPVDVILSLHSKSAPAIVWIGFKSQDSYDLTLTCYNAGENVSREVEEKEQSTVGVENSSPPIPAAIGGTVAGVVFLVIIGFICFHFISKRFGQKSFKRQRSPSWWDRIRQEDRLAEMSQLGPASNVIVDRGRHMTYGKHPPTRRTFPTSDTNPPIHIVSGSAVPQDSVVEDTDVIYSRRNSSYSEHPDANGAGGAVRSMAVPGDVMLTEPSVQYTVTEEGAEPQSVVIINNGCKVKVYEIPPLTIKELD